MANTLVTLNTGVKKLTLNTSGTEGVGNADPSRVSKWRIHAKVGGASPGSAVPKLRLTGSGLTGTDLIAVVYYKDSDTTAITAGTGITANGIYEVVADRCDLYFDYTSGADGMILYLQPVLG